MHTAFYVTSSRKGRNVRPPAETVGSWLDLETIEARPLPADQPGLVLTAAGPRLVVPGAAPLWWSPGLTPRRLKRGAGDTLRRAIQVSSTDTVLDCTLGLGFDTLVLAQTGAHVTAWERHSAILYFTLDGIHRYRPDLARRISGRCCDTVVGLATSPVAAFDHVYLDPMFAEGGAGPNLAPLRALPDAGFRADGEIIAAALRVARRSVVLKLAPDDGPPTTEGLPTPTLITSKRMSYARWTPA